MLRIEGLTYRIGPRTLFENADAAINEGHRVGFVGRNGAGKTTLLNMIMGSIIPDTGVIDYPNRWRIGITRQEAPSGSQSLVDTVMSADRELVKLNKEADTATDPNRIAEIHTRLHEKEAHRARSRASRLLAGLGFSEAEMQRPCDEFPAVGACVSPSRACCLRNLTSCYSMNQPTISTSRPVSG